MPNEQEAGSAATAAKSQEPVNIQARLDAALAEWRKTGCTFKKRNALGQVRVCAAPPHAMRQTPVNEAGDIVFKIGCAKGHNDVWELALPYAEIKAEQARQQDAQARAEGAAADGRDPLTARITITMNVRTGEVALVDPWVPSPVVGLGMLVLAQKMLLDHVGPAAAKPANGLLLPTKAVLDPKTGKPVN